MNKSKDYSNLVSLSLRLCTIVDVSDQLPTYNLARKHIVFISHAASDYQLSEREVCPVLHTLHLDYHLHNSNTIKSPEYSELYRRSVTKSIHRCGLFLLILSPKSAFSEWVGYEIAQAFKAKKRIVIVLIADCDSQGLDERLKTCESIDFRSFDTGRELLHRALVHTLH